MKLVDRLFDYLHRVFSRDAEEQLVLRIRYDGGGLVITVADAVMTTAVTGGTGGNLVVDLRDYTLAELSDYIGSQPGYSVEYENPAFGSAGAITLLDVVTDQDASNGDHLYAYTSQLRAFLEAYAEELTTARKQIPEVIKQMSIGTAEDDWIDEIGGYYNVPRNPGEEDAAYGPRVIAEVLMPRNNNVAIEEAIRVATGVDAVVTDAELQEDVDYGGGRIADSYGLFDIESIIDLEFFTEDIPIDEYAERVYALIDRFRAGGTHLRSITTKVRTKATLHMGAASVIGCKGIVYNSLVYQTYEAKSHVGGARQVFEMATIYPRDISYDQYSVTAYSAGFSRAFESVRINPE